MIDTCIEKKAFFGRRDLKKMAVPEQVRSVGDWAFASCRNLEEVEFAGDHVTLGKAVFQKCERLRKIEVRGKHPDVAYLLGMVPVQLGDPYLLNFSDAGSERWLERLDGVLLARLHEHEMEGFAGQFVCGEEDSGRKNEEDYKEERRRGKAELAYTRLLHPLGLRPETETELRNYLYTHRKGCASEASWRTLLVSHGTDMDYAALYLDVTKGGEDFLPDLDAHLKDIKEECPELKAFFLRGGNADRADEDFFGGLALDL